MIDLTTDHWDDANPEAVPPPVLTPNHNYTTANNWHSIGGMDAVAEETAERQEARKEKEAARDKKIKKKKIQKQDDFNFSRIFAARQAGYKGVIRH